MTCTVVCVCLTAFLLSLVNAIGFGRLAERLVSVFDTIFGGAAYREYKKKWAELNEMRTSIATISAQDEFARWARLQRKIDSAQAEYDKLSSERSRHQLASKMKCSLIVRLAYTLGMAYFGWKWSREVIKAPIIWRLYGESSLDIFGRTLIYPDGSISVLIMFAIFTQFSGQVLRIFL